MNYDMKIAVFSSYMEIEAGRMQWVRSDKRRRSQRSCFRKRCGIERQNVQTAQTWTPTSNSDQDEDSRSLDGNYW